MRDATAVVAHGDSEVVVDVNLYSLAGIHAELVDGIVHRLLQEHINAVLGQTSVTETAYVHTGSHTDMLDIGQGLDVGVNVFCLRQILFFRFF